MPYLTRDGVRLYYEDSGSGTDAMVFVHGWCCTHEDFAPQAEHFSPRFRTIAVDLRGHGLSDAPEQPYSIHGFADDVAWMCWQLGVERAILVGHSMGGLTAFVLAAEHPQLVRAAVLIDAPLVFSQEGLAWRRPILETFWSEDYVNAAVSYANDRFFIDTDDPQRRAGVLERIAAMPRHVLASAWGSIFETDTGAAARALGESGLPMLYIGSARPFAELEPLVDACPHVVIGQTAGAGHFCQLEVPDQVNAMIERFLRVAV